MLPHCAGYNCYMNVFKLCFKTNQMETEVQPAAVNCWTQELCNLTTMQEWKWQTTILHHKFDRKQETNHNKDNA